MSTFLFPGFESMSQFVPRNPDGTPKHRGACGVLATLVCLHVIDPAHWPLTPAGMEALFEDMERHGALMRSDGESNIPGLDRYLNAIGVPHQTVGYDAFMLEGLHARLKALDSPDPRLVVVEWSAAGKGLHDDEANVAYHYSAFGGIDTARGYYRGDGDSSTDDRTGKPTSAIITGWPSIVDAKPIAFIVIDVPAALKPKPATPAPAYVAPATDSPAPKPAAIKPAPAAKLPPPVPAPAPSPIFKPLPPPAQPTPQQPDMGGVLLNIVELMKLARAYQSLTPAQRAVLRLVEGLALTALVAALPIVAQALGHQAVNWGVVLQAAGGAALLAIFSALLKYAKAHADPAL